MSHVIISDVGKLLVNRRKLKPTHAERTICGEGTGADLKVVKTPYGIIGATECWEHTQPLITYAMASMNEQIHIAAWPATAFDNPGHLTGGCEGPITLTRTYAMQTRTYTLLTSGLIGDAAVNFFCGDDEVKKKY
jgi:aliphatic nitrilase